MGTNYYAIPKATDEIKKMICDKVNEGDFVSARKLMPDKVHIGKSSSGWRFLFNHNNWEYFKKDLLDLELFLGICTIKDEYGRELTDYEFWRMVKSIENLSTELNYGTVYFGLNFSDSTDFS